MTSLIKNQILKHLTRYFKDLAPEQLQLSAFKGSCELSNLQLEEKVLMDLLSFPAWMKINKAGCDQLIIRIPWTKLNSSPIQMNLNEVFVEVEVCEEFRDIDSGDELNLANLINVQAPGKYGFVDRVIDGMTVTVNSVLIKFTSRLMSATFNLSRVIFESRCPNWKPGELSLTRIKDASKSQILLFKIAEWSTMRLEAKCLTDPYQAPLRLITNHAQCRLTIKKRLDDCSVAAASIFVIFEDILWVLTFAQFISAASFVEYVFTLIKRSPMSKKTGLLDGQSNVNNNSSMNNSSTINSQATAPLISPLSTPIHSGQPHNQLDKAPILTGNMTSASLSEQKFLWYDVVETSLHLYIDKVDAHLYDDLEISPKSSGSETGGALQTTFDQIQVDCYPYSRVVSNRKHWFKWFDPSPGSRKQWINSHFAEFDLAQVKKMKEFQDLFSNHQDKDDKTTLDDSNFQAKKQIPTAANEQMLSLTVLVKVKDYCMNCVATKHSARGARLNKFIQTDKDYHMPSEMPSIYLELNYFYYFDNVNLMMIYEDVPDPLAFIHLSPTKLLFDSPTLIFLNSFQVNLSKALVHLNDLFPDNTAAPKVHCRIEFLMPQISLPAKVDGEQPNAATSTLLVKSGKVTLCNSIYDKALSAKLMETIEKLRESPSQPINFGGGGYQTNSAKKENSCIGDWNKIWNTSLIEKMNEYNSDSQLWSLQFEPVWMDFMNYDVDDLANAQRLEPIVEPVNAYAFIHLDLSLGPNSLHPEQTSDVKISEKKRDIISVLVTMMDGSILANMDKVQFGFLQRLGMHVEKLLQQIRSDATGIIELETTLEDSVELNLTAYIKDIKARLILDKKTEMKSVPVLNDSYKTNLRNHMQSSDTTTSSLSFVDGKQAELSRGGYINSTHHANLFEEKPRDEFLGVAYQPNEPVAIDGAGGDGYGSLDECVEVADDAACLFLADSKLDSSREASSLPINTKGSDVVVDQQPRKNGKSPIEESLLINLDEMEQSSALFAKVDLKSQQPSPKLTHLPSPLQQQPAQQEIETESISYLELSMSQLMVRRITETKRRQKF